MYTIKLIRDLNYDEKFWNVSAEAVAKEQEQRRSGRRENKTESEISWQERKFLSEKFAIFLLLGMNLRTKYSFALWQTAMAWHRREKAEKNNSFNDFDDVKLFLAYEKKNL